MQFSAAAALYLTILAVNETQSDKDEGVEKEESLNLMSILPSILILTFFNIAPIAFFIILKIMAKKDRLNDEDVKNKISTMYATV